MSAFDPPTLRLRWREGAFLHWPVDPAAVRPHLPAGLEPAVRDGTAWVSVVPFVLDRVGPPGIPLSRSFPQVNVRTYVRPVRDRTIRSETDPVRIEIGSASDGAEADESDEADGSRAYPGGRTREAARASAGGAVHEPDRDRGVYFFALDLADPIAVAVARRLFDLPVYRAEIRTIGAEAAAGGDEVAPEAAADAAEATADAAGATDAADGVRFVHRRTHRDAPPARFDGTVRPRGPVEPAVDGPLEAFLAENYRFYAASDGRLRCGTISHEPWSLRPASAEIRANSLLDAVGLDRPESDPIVHCVGPVTIRTGSFDPVGRE